MMEVITEIISVRDETHDVKTFRLKRPEAFDFIPGQFCMLSFPDGSFDGEKRPFTLNSTPSKDFLDFSIKRYHEFTTKIHTLKANDKIRIRGPMGDIFNFDDSTRENLVFLAGGTGITPFMSIIRHVAEKDLPNRLILINSNRKKEDIIFREELDRLDSDQIKVVNTLTDESSDWEGETGRIDKEMIQKHVDFPERYIWMVCGPPGMVKAMEGVLEEIGIPKERIRIDPWNLQ